MRIALNGYFWGQPRTGSGQYTRHLWESLPSVWQGTRPPPELLMLLPPGKSVDGPPGALVGKSALFSRLPLLPRSVREHPDISKILWESWGVSADAQRKGAELLHIPYLSAPFRKPMPTVVTAHDMIPWVVPGYGGSPAVRLYFMIAAASVRRAGLIVTDSDASSRDAIKVLKVPPSRVRTVYLGTDPHPEYPPEMLSEVRLRYGLPPDFAFYISGFDRRKNVPLLLGAWRGFLSGLGDEWCARNRPVLAIGGSVPTPGGLFPDVRGTADSLGLRYDGGPGSTVAFLGRISEEDKPLLMAAARLFIYPSAYEGFGLDPLEAMSVGCPVVSSSGGSLVEVVGDAGVLVPPDDAQALQHATNRVWTDSALQASLSARGRERAALFTWERTAQQMWKLYGELARRLQQQHKRKDSLAR